MKEEPKTAKAWYSKGVNLGKLERYEEALKAYEQAIRIEPEDAKAWYNKGCALGKLERYEEALKAFEQAIRIEPEDAEAWHNKGFALGELERYEEALKAYEQAIRIETEFAEAWFGKGFALGELERYEEALTAFEQATRIEPERADAWSNKGVLLGQLGRYKEALKACEQAIKIKPKYAGAHCSLAELLFKLCDYGGAQQKVEQALGIDSNLVCALLLHGRIKVEDKGYLEAVDSFDKAVTLSPGDQISILWKAYARYLNLTFSPCLSDKKRDEELSGSMRELERAKELSESHKSEILYFLGFFYYKCQDIVSARIKLEECLVHNSKHKLAKELLHGIWNYKIRPPWWQWWLGAPNPLASKRKKAVFSLISLAILALLVFSCFATAMPTYGLVIALVFLVFILVSPSVVYFKGREIEIQLQQPSFEPTLAPSTMEERIKAAEEKRE